MRKKLSKINPSHYSLPNGLEAYDVTQHFDFTTGNCIKYLWRAGRKDGESSLDDLRKVRWYLNQLIEREELNVAESKRKTYCPARGLSPLANVYTSFDLDRYPKNQGG